MRRLVLLAVLLAAFAAQAQLPPGKWWRKPELVRQLALSEDQQMRLDQIFRGAANDLIDLRGEVEKQSVALRGELDQPQLNRGNIRGIGAKLNEARGRLFDRELTMLVDMRGVLNDQQWNRMRAVLDRPRMQERMQGRQQPQ
ncbi:MAG TPA: periplasmic heavy metal sensor [Thermoanaerobaculia bacterium]|jgi:hypothetical protein|nr:periplasmic heavy metal sensor [Thermoanaerobaculia bacterium]